MQKRRLQRIHHRFILNSDITRRCLSTQNLQNSPPPPQILTYTYTSYRATQHNSPSQAQQWFQDPAVLSRPCRVEARGTAITLGQGVDGATGTRKTPNEKLGGYGSADTSSYEEKQRDRNTHGDRGWRGARRRCITRDYARTKSSIPACVHHTTKKDP